MERCFIAIGSNLEQPLQQVSLAVTELDTIPDTSLNAVSRWYQSAAIGPGNQPDYVNGVAELNTSLNPLDLLNQLQHIENQHQRKREQRWGARTLDLDLLYYGEQTINNERLTVPHPRLLERNFVLIPLLDLAPELSLHNGKTVRQQIIDSAMPDLQLVDPESSPTIRPQ